MYIGSSSTGLFSGKLYTGSSSSDTTSGSDTTSNSLTFSDSVEVDSSLTMQLELAKVYSSIKTVQSALTSVDPSLIDNDLLTSYQTTLADANSNLQSYSGYSSSTQYQLASSLLDSTSTSIEALKDTGLDTNSDTVAMDTTLETTETNLTTTFDDLEGILDLLTFTEGEGNLGDAFALQNLVTELDNLITSGSLSADVTQTLTAAKSALELEMTEIETAVAGGATHFEAFVDSYYDVKSIKQDIEVALSSDTLTTADKEGLTTVDARLTTILGGGSTKEELAALRDDLRLVADDLDAVYATNNAIKGALQNTYDALPGLIDSITSDLMNSSDLETALQDAKDAISALATSGSTDVQSAGLNNTKEAEAQEYVDRIGSTTAASDQMLLIGDERQVNTYSDKNQKHAEVVTFDDGSYLVAYKSENFTGDNSLSLVAQRFDVSGQAIGDEFVLGTTTPLSGKKDYSIALMDDGSLVATWEADGSSGLRAQQFQVDGTAIGSEITVTTGTKYDQAEVIALEGGGFAISYVDATQKNDSQVYAKVYDANGTEVTGEISVGTESGNQADAQIIGLDGGGFAVAYTDYSGSDGDGTGVVMKIYDANGVQQGSDVQVNETTSQEQVLHGITVLADGHIVVSYSSGADSSSSDLMIREFESDGTAHTSEIQVNPDGTPIETSSITALADGGFAIAFTDATSGKETEDIYIQRYDASGVSDGEAIQIASGEKRAEASGITLGATSTGLVISYDKSVGNSSEVFSRSITLLNEGVAAMDALAGGGSNATLDTDIYGQTERVESLLASDSLTQQDAQELYNRLKNMSADLDRLIVSDSDQATLDMVKASIDSEMTALSSYVNTTDLDSATQATSLESIGGDLQKVLDLLSSKTPESGSNMKVSTTGSASTVLPKITLRETATERSLGAQALEKLGNNPGNAVNFKLLGGFGNEVRMVREINQKRMIEAFARSQEAFREFRMGDESKSAVKLPEFFALNMESLTRNKNSSDFEVAKEKSDTGLI